MEWDGDTCRASAHRVRTPGGPAHPRVGAGRAMGRGAPGEAGPGGRAPPAVGPPRRGAATILQKSSIFLTPCLRLFVPRLSYSCRRADARGMGRVPTGESFLRWDSARAAQGPLGAPSETPCNVL